MSTFNHDKFITLDFLRDEVLPGASASTTHLMLPLKCANEDNFAAMKKVALNCECEEIAEFLFYFHSKISSVAGRKFEIEGIPSAIFATKKMCYSFCSVSPV